MESTSRDSDIKLDNSGHTPLQVPGFGGLPISYELDPKTRFCHGMQEFKQTPAVTARELAMVAVMNTLTDKPEWHDGIFNDNIVANWREEAFATTPLMSDKAWNWCLNELRDKAVYFRENHHVRVLDTGSCICKSDTPASQALAASFRDAPALDKQIFNLVDPSLFPLVYGRSLVLFDGGQVNLQDVFGSYQGANVVPKHFDRRADSQEVQNQIDKGYSEVIGARINRYVSKYEYYNWSANYQWLPCEAEFIEDTGTEVRITSYINNLHPTHKLLYTNIRKLISMAIKPWNDCLVRGQDSWNDCWHQGQRGPIPLRIKTYGIEWENELPGWALAFRIPNPSMIKTYHEAQELLRSTTEEDTIGRSGRRTRAELITDFIAGSNLELPPPDSELWKMAEECLRLPEAGSSRPMEIPEGWSNPDSYPWGIIGAKHRRLLHFKHPEPGTAFSYEDWKSGSCNRAIIDIISDRSEWKDDGDLIHDRPVDPDHEPHKVALQDEFRKQGLQVVVKLESIELTPENPTYSNGSWQLDGLVNEHIVAVAMFSYDILNIRETRISFRQETPIHENMYRYREDRRAGRGSIWHKAAHEVNKIGEIAALAEILGFEERDLLKNIHDTLPFQNIGSVAMPQGRLITFPNTMEYQVEPFQLEDPSLPGHHRFVKLYLVDPHYRVCSTRNVPPQQKHWWEGAASDELVKLGMPREIISEITRATDDWLMDIEETKKYRLEIMKEHRWSDMVRYNRMPHYAFW
ncbi:hypothetical protein TARUN_1131 [Trichoderma arundinaceum]|uniref:Uncharacterized protein n=1 Tax=Trichoderma arundinaceum TaxID=490622 RepID=A0A395NY82_TRIAR|nr:hypothetical protein TARUN_1131 [Trichoderma arundinaceum]